MWLPNNIQHGKALGTPLLWYNGCYETAMVEIFERVKVVKEKKSNLFTKIINVMN